MYSIPVSVTTTIGVTVLAVILSGCQHMVPILVPPPVPPPPTAAVFKELEAGDEVRVTLQSGNSATFVIAEVQADALVAKDGRRFNYADMAQLEERRIAKAKTIALITAMPFIMLVLVGLTYHGP